MIFVDWHARAARMIGPAVLGVAVAAAPAAAEACDMAAVDRELTRTAQATANDPSPNNGADPSPNTGADPSPDRDEAAKPSGPAGAAQPAPPGANPSGAAPSQPSGAEAAPAGQGSGAEPGKTPPQR